MIGGISLLIFGSKIQKILVETFVGYSTFMVALAYCYEIFIFSNGISLLIALILGPLASYGSHKARLSKNFIASLGVVIGLLFSLFMISLLSIYHDFLVYPLIIFGCVFGAAAFFKSDDFFAAFSSLVGALVTV